VTEARNSLVVTPQSPYKNPTRWAVRPTEPRVTRVDALIALAFVAAAFWLRHRQLGPPSLWLDDAWPALVIKTPWASITKVGLTAPGYAVLVKSWLYVTGFSETKAQSVAFTAGIVAPALLWLLCLWRGLGRPAAAVAATVMLTAPADIVYSARVKQYTLDSVLVIIVLALAWRLLDHPGDTARWVALVAGCALATATSATVIPVVGGALLAAIVSTWRDNRPRFRVAGILVGTYSLFALVWWRVVLRPRLGTALREYWSAFYVSTKSPKAFATSLLTAAARFSHGFTRIPGAVIVILFVAAAFVVIRMRTDLAILFLAPPAFAVALATRDIAPIGTGRTDIYLYPVLALLLAVAVSEATSQYRSGTALALILVVACLATATVPRTYPRENIKPAIARLVRDAQSTDTVLVYPGGRYALALYAPPEWPIQIYQSTAVTNGFDVRIRRPHLTILPSYPTLLLYERSIGATTRGASRVWLIGSHGRLDVRKIEQALSGVGFHVKLNVHDHETVFVQLWLRPPP
jgi:Dolichyl-phosphate-mannose-protein mannosyltransferase